MRKRYILLPIFLFAGFIFFSYLTSLQLFTKFDLDLTIKLQNIIPRFWDSPFSILSLLGSAEITGLFWLGILLWAILRRWWTTVAGLSLLVVSQIIGVFGKLFLFHPAPPFEFFRGVKLLGLPSQFIQTDFSYPSGHTMRTTFLVIFLFALCALKLRGVKGVITQLFLVIFVIMMLISRVYLGEHWISDVIGGALLGGATGLLAASTLPKLKT